MAKTFIDKDGKNKITRISRWITIQTAYTVNKRNALYDYATDGYGYRSYDDKFDPENHDGLYLDFFRFNGRKYATSQFYALGSMWLSMAPYVFQDTDGYDHFIAGMEMDEGCYIDGTTLYAEFDECGERVRLYHIEPIR